MSASTGKDVAVVHCPWCGSTNGYAYDFDKKEGGTVSWLQRCSNEKITFAMETSANEWAQRWG